MTGCRRRMNTNNLKPDNEMKKRMLFLLLTLGLAGCSSDEKGSGDRPAELPEVTAGSVWSYKLDATRSSKRGVSYSYRSVDDVTCLGEGIVWSYNWGPDTRDEEVITEMDRLGIRFCPMAWNDRFDPDRIRAWKASHPATEYLLAYNEPNLTDQASMTPVEAAEAWPAVRAIAQETGLKIISPAMNYGTLAGYGDPIVWLDEFFDLIGGGDEIAGISIHCYMGSAASLKSYVERFYKYGKPIWLTEFCAWEKNIGSADDQMGFMSEALNYLESDPQVAGYAWFIPRGQGVGRYPYHDLLAGNPAYLTPLGRVYVRFSAFDTARYYGVGETIPAESYAACNAADCIGTGEWKTTAHIRPTTDSSGELEVCRFLAGQWLEYGVAPAAAGVRRVVVRYAAQTPVELTFTAGDGTQAVLALEATGGDTEWRTAWVDLAFPAGEQRLRVTQSKGFSCINWFVIL